MKTLSIDIETYSGYDLSKCGVYKYAESPDFEILLFGYSVDGGEVQVIDLAADEHLPPEILNALTDDNVQKWAFNANFERVCLSRYLRDLGINLDPFADDHFSSQYLGKAKYLNPASWRCAMVWSAYMGLPLSLEGAGAVLGLEKQKLTEGKDLIRYFCSPCKPTATNGQRMRNRPEHAPDKWAAFKAYNKRDVEAEMSIQERLIKFPVPDSVWEEYRLDQEINDRGVKLDMTLVRNAIKADARSKTELTRLMREITGLDNPNSVAQMKQWLCDNELETDTLGKKAVAELLKTAPEPLGKALSLRQQLAKSSVKKYQTMENAVCSDGRARGMFQFYGANRTGRWCLTGDHEVLTPYGWRRLDSRFNGRPVMAVYDSVNGDIRFERCKIISFDYKGDMYLWEDKRVSQFSTPEHRNLVTDSQGKTSARYVADIPSKVKLPVCGNHKPHTDQRYKDAELRLLVAYQADGIAAGGAKNGLAFRFTKQRKIQRMRNLLRAAGYEYSEYLHGDSATCFRVSANIYNPAIKTKQFGWWLLNENPDVFFEEIGHWDGHAETDNSVQYVTTNRLNAEIVATFAHLSGRAAIINTKKSTQCPRRKAALYVEIWNSVQASGVTIPSAPHIQENFSVKVYCAETTTGYFLTRRHNKIWVTGNSGRILQPQNLPQNHLPDLEQARELVRSGNFTALEFLYDSVPEVLSELIRTAFVPKEGTKLVVADFSAIEARVIAWLAGERWRNDVFATHGKIYEASASQMFRVPIEEITKGSPLRQKGKIAELALGYGGSVGALKAMGALEMGLGEDELQPLVTAWRSANPNIVRLWWDVDRAAMTAVRDRTLTETHGIKFGCQSGMLFITLPSGRRLSYVKPRIGTNQFGSPCVTYEGVGDTKKWERLETYGPKLVENIVQATSRDILCYAMQAQRCCDIVMHVHDEIVIEADPRMSTKVLCEQMSRTPPWADGLLLRADGYECSFYKKD